MKFLSSVLLVGSLTVFGGRLQGHGAHELKGNDGSGEPGTTTAGDGIKLRGVCDCSWTTTWSCKGFPLGSDRLTDDDDTVCYEYCCGEGLQQCLKCDTANTTCNTTIDPTECAKFRRNSSNGLWESTDIGGQCLDVFDKNRFGVHKCKYEGDRKNQRNEEDIVTGKSCFHDRSSDPVCVDDASKHIRLQQGDGDGRCLKCDQMNATCGTPEVHMGECSEFEKSGNKFKIANSSWDQCLDRFENESVWGIWKCIDDNDNQKVSVVKGNQLCVEAGKADTPKELCVRNPDVANEVINLRNGTSSKCLKCDEIEQLCTNGTEQCSTFTRNNNGLWESTDKTGYCLDAFQANYSFGLWKCKKGGADEFKNQINNKTVGENAYCFDWPQDSTQCVSKHLSA